MREGEGQNIEIIHIEIVKQDGSLGILPLPTGEWRKVINGEKNMDEPQS